MSGGLILYRTEDGQAEIHLRAHDGTAWLTQLEIAEPFALSVDCADREQQAQHFFAEVQNKLLHAVTRKTAAELVVARADASQPNMALQSFSASRVRKTDVIVAKNCLSADEIDTLNRLVAIFLEQAELRVKDRQPLTLDYWRGNVDKLLAFNDRPVLKGNVKGNGSMGHAAMKTIVHERYEAFDARRHADEARLADADDVQALEAVERQLKKSGKGSKG